MPISGLRHRVDLNLSSVLLLEDSIQIDKDIRCLSLGLFVLEAQLLRDAQSLFFGQARVEVNGGGDDGRRVLGGDFLDVHAALGGGDEDDTFGGTVIEDGDVVFVCRVAALGEHDLANDGVSLGSGEGDRKAYRIADTTSCTSLLGDEVGTEHFGGIVFGLFRAAWNSERQITKIFQAMYPTCRPYAHHPADRCQTCPSRVHQRAPGL